MSLPDYKEVRELVLAARSAALHLDGELFSLKRSLCDGDGKGGSLPFNRRTIDRDDRLWVEQEERRFARLNSALAAFGAAIDNPAGA